MNTAVYQNCQVSLARFNYFLENLNVRQKNIFVKLLLLLRFFETFEIHIQNFGFACLENRLTKQVTLFDTKNMPHALEWKEFQKVV